LNGIRFVSPQRFQKESAQATLNSMWVAKSKPLFRTDRGQLDQAIFMQVRISLVLIEKSKTI